MYILSQIARWCRVPAFQSHSMDQTTAKEVVNVSPSSSSLVILILALTFILILKNFSRPSSKRWRLPPGPKPWPIIGNILHLGEKPHIAVANFAKLHGPLISLRLGTQLLVFGSSPEAAAEIFRTHDRSLSGRQLPKVAPYDSHVTDRLALIWSSDCSDHWKFLRGLCRTELFSSKAIESQASLREKKVAEMMDFLASREGKIVNIGEAVFATVFNIMGNLLLSRDFIGLKDGVLSSKLKSIVWKMLELGAAPNISEFYPFLAPLDLQGLKRKNLQCVNEMYATWAECIRERRESSNNNNNSQKADFLDVFLANGFDDDQINWLLLELIVAGTDTNSTTVEWAMTELLKNKEVMNKAREELQKEIETSNSLNESRIIQLSYLNACVKETLRLHPPAPFLVPHRAVETCEVMGYTIPKNSKVIVNVWAIGRDPSVWEDPLSFKPERFLGSNLDFKGHDYELLPFGAGRRICPGLPMATVQVHLILASLIGCFDWSLPEGKDPSKLDMSEKFGMTLQKEKPLLFVPKRIV